MVGLVFVSHSRALAEALINLVRQVSANEVAIALAAGVGDDRTEFGTDAIELMEAIQAVDSPDGVLVLMDLGSAVLSAEMALDLLPPEVSARVRLCPAPMIEGAIAAAVQAGLGSDLDTVCSEARSALLPKIEQIGGEAPQAAPAPESGLLETKGVQVRLVVKNLHGLHARPAARFVKAAGSFDADLRVQNLTNGKGPVSAKSLNAVATLGAVRGHEILIQANGPQAEQAIQSLTEMVEAGFGEMEEEELLPVTGPPREAAPKGVLVAIPISEGVALGPLYRYEAPLPPIDEHLVEDSAAEWKRMDQAIAQTREEIRQRRRQLTASLGEEQAAIFDAHELILQDPDLIERVRSEITNQRMNASMAWDRAIRAVAADFRALDDPYLKQRAVDVMDVGHQVLFALAGDEVKAKVELSEPVVLFAHELTPTETSQLDMSKILGILTVGGGPTSHSAILARALGIPALSGVTTALEDLEPGTLIGLDGGKGQVWVDPLPEIRSDLLGRREAWIAERQKLRQSSQALAQTADGKRVEVVANIGGEVDARAAVENGAEGVGLLRTEFLYLTRSTPPSEDEQVEMLTQICQVITQSGSQNWPVLVRTLDVGGDKELPYIELAPEANPFLGVRAIRLGFQKPELFMTQLRAILRAGVHAHLRVMFPMVATLEEVKRARAMMVQAHQELEAEGTAHAWPMETGIMVEIPAAAVLSSVLAAHVDFFSIGTNDLTQYTMAAERGNPALSTLADGLHPAVLSLIRMVTTGAHAQGKWVGVCGELGGDPLAVPVLAGLEVDELSMNPAAIPRAKAILRVIDSSQAQALAERVLAAEDAVQARQIAGEFYAAEVAPKLG
jgi:phosphocarrier protein FPr